MSAVDVLERAKKQLAELTLLKPVGVSKASKDEKGWRVGVEMLEMARIPPASDILGCYDVLVDEEGQVVSFERKRTRLRGEPMEVNGDR